MIEGSPPTFRALGSVSGRSPRSGSLIFISVHCDITTWRKSSWVPSCKCFLSGLSDGLDMFGHVWTNDGFTYHMESYGSWDSLAQRPCSMAPSKSDASRRGRPASLSKMRHWWQSHRLPPAAMNYDGPMPAIVGKNNWYQTGENITYNDKLVDRFIRIENPICLAGCFYKKWIAPKVSVMVICLPGAKPKKREPERPQHLHQNSPKHILSSPVHPQPASHFTITCGHQWCLFMTNIP